MPPRVGLGRSHSWSRLVILFFCGWPWSGFRLPSVLCVGRSRGASRALASRQSGAGLHSGRSRAYCIWGAKSGAVVLPPAAIAESRGAAAFPQFCAPVNKGIWPPLARPRNDLARAVLVELEMPVERAARANTPAAGRKLFSGVFPAASSCCPCVASIYCL